MEMLGLEINLDELQVGRNYGQIVGVERNEKIQQIFDVSIKMSNGIQEKFGVYDDSSRVDGQVRKLVKATILEEGVKRYNLGEIVGKYIIVDIQKAVSKKGNEFWKISNFEKVTKDTDLSEFEIIACEKPNVKFGEVEIANDINELESMLDKDEQ